MPKTIHFNTGRKYTVHGQRITATLHDDGVVTFWDHDRQVHGEYPHTNRIEVFTQAQVTEIYDLGHHSGTSRAWADGLSRGGCNSKWEG